jgi:FkbM family methyltransferase
MNINEKSERRPGFVGALRAWAIGRFRSPLLGVPAAVLCHRLGADETSRKFSTLCGYVPPVVDVFIGGDRSRPPSFRMRGAGGREHVARSLWWGGWEAYEKPMPDLFAACCREARHVLDVGGYSGFYAMIAASFPNVAKSYAFEPLPEMRAVLEENVRLNRLGDRIEVIPSAVSDHAGEADFFVPTTRTGLMESSSSLNPEFHESHLQTLRVPLVTLDDFADERGCRPVELMKIDVETQEHRVLLGAQRILREDRPVIFLEILAKADCDALESIRAERNYACGLLHPGGVTWRSSAAHVEDRNDQVFCPVERLGRFEALVRSAGYEVS